MARWLQVMAIAAACALILAGVLFWALRPDRYLWSYTYRDEGGNIVFVTRGFDLILLESVWETEGFRAGNGVLLTRPIPGVSFSGSILDPTHTDAGTELSFPEHVVTIVDGNVVEIDGTAISLSARRKRIIVQPDGTIDVKEPDTAEGWQTLEYIRQLSDKYRRGGGGDG